MANPDRDLGTVAVMVAQLKPAKTKHFYLLTVIDPYRGPQETTCHYIDEITEVVRKLDWVAEIRHLKFEVHDFSTGSQVVLQHTEAEHAG